ncbi:AAA family ATPase [Desulfobacterales bacterium HSG2]|nr:AAA family ATPase [Desulfobacterales bacterium HSG2]
MKKHLENLMIHRFRGLRELELSGLGRINLLVGANNSGKTSVLEAVSTYCRPLDPLEWLNTAWRREMTSSRVPMLDALKWLFPQTNHQTEDSLYSGETFVSGNGDFCVAESHGSYSEILSADQAEPSEDESLPYASDNIRRGANFSLKAMMHSRADGPQEISENFQLWQNERFVSRQKPRKPILPAATITPFSHWVEQTQIGQFTEIDLNSKAGEIIEIIKQTEPGISELKILSPEGIRPILYIRHDDLGLSPFSAMGDGVRRTLTIALNMLLAENGILLIDEIETAIHTSALVSIFRWMAHISRSLNVQIFATTHSLEAVDAMLESPEDDEGEEDLVIYRLNRTREKTAVTRLDWDTLCVLRTELGQEVR